MDSSGRVSGGIRKLYIQYYCESKFAFHLPNLSVASRGVQSSISKSIWTWFGRGFGLGFGASKMQIRRNQVEIVGCQRWNRIWTFTISLVECLAASEFKCIVLELRVVNIVENRVITEQMTLRGSPVSRLSKTEVHEHMKIFTGLHAKRSHVCVVD
jgi:hypothetical protein